MSIVDALGVLDTDVERGAGDRASGCIVLFSPEHFYVWNTLAVPQLTGYLLDHGYQVQQRVLDNEFYRFIAEAGTLDKALAELGANRPRLAGEQVAYLAEAISLARIPQEIGFRAVTPDQAVSGLIRHRDAVVRLLHRSEALLRERFLGLSKDRFLLALARLQVAVDLFFASAWPTKYGVLGGLQMSCGTERSSAVAAATGDDVHNPFLAYYRARVVPTIPGDALLAGISITHEAQIIPAFTLARVIREQRPDLHIVLGGATVSTLREGLGAGTALTPFYDSYVVGAGERPLAALYDALAAGSSGFGDVPSLVWRRRDGSMQHNPVCRDFTLDDVATPVFTDPRPRPVLTLASSSGCDWARCRFCHFPKILGDESRYCTRSAEAFVRDVETLNRRHQPTYYHLCDTNLSVGQLDTLADALLAASVDASFYAFVRAEKAFTDLEFCRKVRKAGFFALHFGLESGSQAVLDRVHKGIDLANVSSIIDNFHAVDIVTSVFLMIGMPGETAADIDRTVAFTRAHLDKMSGEIAMCRFFLDVYSDMYERPDAYGVEIVADPEADLATNVRFRTSTGYDPEVMEALVDDFYARIGLPRSYGERFFMEMLSRFCPNGVRQRAALYAPFILGGVRTGLRSLVRGA